MHFIDLYRTILPPYIVLGFFCGAYGSPFCSNHRCRSAHFMGTINQRGPKIPWIFHTLFPIGDQSHPPVVLNMFGRPLHPKSPLKFGGFFWRVSSWQPGTLPKANPPGNDHISPYRLKSALKRGHVIVTGGKSSPLKKGTMLKQLNRHVFNSPPRKGTDIIPPKTQILQTQAIQTTQRMVIYTAYIWLIVYDKCR